MNVHEHAKHFLHTLARNNSPAAAAAATGGDSGGVQGLAVAAAAAVVPTTKGLDQGYRKVGFSPWRRNRARKKTY